MLCQPNERPCASQLHISLSALRGFPEASSEQINGLSGLTDSFPIAVPFFPRLQTSNLLSIEGNYEKRMGLNQGHRCHRCLAAEASHRCKGVGVFAWKEGLKGAVARAWDSPEAFSMGFL